MLPAILAAHLFPAAQTFKMRDRRADFFLIRAPATEQIKIGARGYLRTTKQSVAAGTFIVISAHDGEYLCRIESIRPGVASADLKEASFSRFDIDGAVPFEIDGIQFRPLPARPGYFLSAQPLPLKNVEPANVAGIKKLLFTIEGLTNKGYEALLVSLDDVSIGKLDRIIDFSDKNVIFLGTREGKLGMIYEEQGIYKHAVLSANALEKFRDSIHFFIMLRKLGQNR